MPSTSLRWCCLRPAPSKEKREYSERRRCMYKWDAVPRQLEESRDGRQESLKSFPLCERVTESGSSPSPSGRGRCDSQRVGAPGEGRAKREPDRAKPQEKSIRILRPSPCPLPEAEGDLSILPIHSHFARGGEFHTVSFGVDSGERMGDTFEPLPK